jgi:hypothetical protein
VRRVRASCEVVASSRSARSRPPARPPARAPHLPSPLLLPSWTTAEENLDEAAAAGTVGAIVPLLKALNGGGEAAAAQPPEGVEELERDVCFVLGLLAIRADHQAAICDADALPTLVAIVKRYAARGDPELAGVSAQACRRAADAVTNLAHENNAIKSKVRQEGGVPPLVALLRSRDPKLQRAVAGTLRTLAFKNEENKNLIVDLGALPRLVQMMHAPDSTIHYEAVGVVGNLVHSSQHIKRRVLEEGALQAVINLLSSPCGDSQREAALLLGQFATAEGEFKARIVQRGAVSPLVAMLGAGDPQLREMAAFALGRLAQHADNQAGIAALGGLAPLLALLETRLPNLQHNAAFALYGLSENEDNLVRFVREGAVQRVEDCELGPQASKDCVQKMHKRLQERLGGRALGQILYILQGAGAEARARIAVALGSLCADGGAAPAPADLAAAFVERGALDVLLAALADPATAPKLQRQAARAAGRVARAAGATAPIRAGGDLAPPDPKTVFLGERFVNNATLSDVTFLVEGRPFHAHRIALLASSDTFRAMFDGHYREREAPSIPIPNIRWAAFEAMMRCVYTGSVEVPPELAQELLEAADQYMLDALKRLCEAAIAERLAPDNAAAAFDLAENFNAPELAKRAALFVVERHGDVVAALGATAAFGRDAPVSSHDTEADDDEAEASGEVGAPVAKGKGGAAAAPADARDAAAAAAYAGIFAKMRDRLHRALCEDIAARAAEADDADEMQG